MSVVAAILLMQYVVSVKAGLVNHVQGNANVVEMEMARAARPIRTGVDGYVEVLLRPGSFLRIGENSEVTLNDVDLASVKLTVTQGPAVVEVVEIRKEQPITVTTGNLTMKIVERGIYRFADGSATVIQGKLQAGDSKITYKKGNQIFFQDNYRVRKTGKVRVTSLDVYSQTRSETIARANYSLAASMSGPSSYGIYDIWLFSPFLNMYTFIPRSDYRSPYGHRYYGVHEGRVIRQDASSRDSGSSTSATSGRTTEPSTPRDTGNSNSGGNSGGAPSAPAPALVTTPSGEQMTRPAYIESKNQSVPD